MKKEAKRGRPKGEETKVFYRRLSVEFFDEIVVKLDEIINGYKEGNK